MLSHLYLSSISTVSVQSHAPIATYAKAATARGPHLVTLATSPSSSSSANEAVYLPRPCCETALTTTEIKRGVGSRQCLRCYNIKFVHSLCQEGGADTQISLATKSKRLRANKHVQHAPAVLRCISNCTLPQPLSFSRCGCSSLALSSGQSPPRDHGCGDL